LQALVKSPMRCSMLVGSTDATCEEILDFAELLYRGQEEASSVGTEANSMLSSKSNCFEFYHFKTKENIGDLSE
jgi:hypothetical protein